MPSFSAIMHPNPSEQMNVLFVVYPNIVLLDLVGPLQVFTHSRRSVHSGSAYKTSVVSPQGGTIETNTIVQIDSAPLADWLSENKAHPIHTLIVVGGDGAIPASQNHAFLDQIRKLAGRANRICSVCSGALILAAAGVLDGRRAVTHWEDCERLSAQNPAVRVEVDPIYVKDGNVWTSAGITAGIDMALAIVEEDLGKPAAIEMARSLVTPMVRSGGQSQFSQELDRHYRDVEGQFTRLHKWIGNHIHKRISVDEMAGFCGMSPRNFSRRYTETMGTSPAKALEAMRVHAARDLLAMTDQSIKAIATKCGFLDDERMRRAFVRTINTSPSQYRKQFNLH